MQHCASKLQPLNHNQEGTILLNRALIFEASSSLLLIGLGLWLASQNIGSSGLAITGCLLGAFSITMRAPSLIERVRMFLEHDTNTVNHNSSQQSA